MDWMTLILSQVPATSSEPLRAAGADSPHRSIVWTMVILRQAGLEFLLTRSASKFVRPSRWDT